MTMRQPRYSKEEHARRGTDIYEQQVRRRVEAGNLGKIVAIDADSPRRVGSRARDGAPCWR